jgi:sterol 24-C-methyltransferase
MVDGTVAVVSGVCALDVLYLLYLKGETIPLSVNAFLEAFHKRDSVSQVAMASLVGASAILGAIVVNHAFGTDPIGRTKDMFSKFAVQEKKRNIRVDDWIETYNNLHDDSKEGVEARNSSYTTLVNSYYELATLFYEWGM